MAGIDIEGLATVYPNGVRAVDGLDLHVADGEFFALLGPSGCGKTTLLRTIAGLEPASEGTVRIDAADVTRTEPGKRGVAMVFQDYALFPHMSVSENITYPLKVRRVAAATRADVASRTAGELSLDGLLERKPGQLSGGQQQRVALARAIASEGKVLLLDEPLSNLDARLRLEARTFLKKLQRDLGITTVFVTHDQAEALALADRIAVMDSGKLRQLGSPREVFARPANTFVANFIGSTPMNLLPGKVTADGAVTVAGGSLPATTSSYSGGRRGHGRHPARVPDPVDRRRLRPRPPRRGRRRREPRHPVPRQRRLRRHVSSASPSPRKRTRPRHPGGPHRPCHPSPPLRPRTSGELLTSADRTAGARS